MSDETEMNPEMERFAAKLRNVPAPEATINRDQLMYDAGWAAALSQNTPVSEPIANNHRRGFTSLALSFAGGIAVAAALMLSIVPLTDSDNSSLNFGSEVAATTPESETTEMMKIPEQPSIHIASLESEETDLLDWIENLPPGHRVNASFSSTPAVSGDTDVNGTATLRPDRPKNSGQLLREFLPDVPESPSSPAWSTWLLPGA